MFTATLNAAANTSNLKHDEVIQFFDTTAHFNPDKQYWEVPIHGWVYEPENSKARKKVLQELLATTYGLKPTPLTQANFDRRSNLFFNDNERGKNIIIQINGSQYPLERSAANGHFSATLKFSDEQLDTSKPLQYSAVIPSAHPGRFQGQVHFVPEHGLSIISDIDDTIKISHVTNKKRLFEHTFFKDFTAVPYMAERYQAWSTQGAHVHFVSSSPWQLYPELDDFVNETGFPASTLSLKYVRVKDKTILNLFKKGTETKPQQIKPILNRYPKRKFILVGDTGEQDPEVYARLFAEHPEQIQKIFLRNVTEEAPNDKRFQALFSKIPENRWHLFNDAREIRINLPDNN